MKILLASSSEYRKILLQRLNLPFETHSPDVDEARRPNESGQALAIRLAKTKAQAGVAQADAGTIVIGSDQVAETDGVTLGKPLTHPKAVEQLTYLSGKTITFHTAVCMQLDGRQYEAYVPTEITLRTLEAPEIERYIALDQPLHCSGALKTEALGVSLMERFESEDPTAIIGLPLISVCHGLRFFGVPVP